jgi:RNA polymerase sigma-70 factor (ECF subfamily)
MGAVTIGTMIDTEGFDSQYQMMFRDLVSLARSLGADGDAEDVAQEAILDARRRLHQLRNADSLRAWVRRIAIRGAGRARRRLAASGALVEERQPLTAMPDVDIATAIATLPERERLAVTLVFGLGFRQDEAAELMGVASGTVYSSVWRARRKLAHLLAVDEGPAAARERAGR